MKLAGFILGMLALIPLLYAVLVIAASVITEYRPPPRLPVTIKAGDQDEDHLPERFSLVSWNMGYGSLGREMDFFYEGGQMVRPRKDQVFHYLEGIREVLLSLDHVAVILLQEVDSDSRRSYHTPQAAMISQALPGFEQVYALNYSSFHVPLPFLSPMGRVRSGLLTLSATAASEALRLSSQKSYSWPKRLFMPQRCILMTRYGTQPDKDLVILHIHNSAYDDAATLRESELALIRETAVREFENGCHVIIGGDWNQNPPGYDTSRIAETYRPFQVSPMDPGFLPAGWQWAFDPSMPTNRKVNMPYVPGETGTTVIDFFALSPNIAIENVSTPDLGFEYSDHHPVLLKVMLLYD